MAFTRNWNAAYEAEPPDSDSISLGAGEIRDLKSDVQERFVIDHSHAGDADDGKHKQLTFVNPLGADPGDVADEGMLYTKDVSAKAELFWKDEDGNVSQLTSVGSGDGFPSNTSMLFYQSAAPIGWAKDTASALDDHALRVVTSTAWAGGTNGTSAFSTVFAKTATDGFTLTTNEMPAHAHVYLLPAVTSLQAGATSVNAGANATTNTTSVGGDAAHAHNIDIRVKYINLIRATKA